MPQNLQRANAQPQPDIRRSRSLTLVRNEALAPVVSVPEIDFASGGLLSCGANDVSPYSRWAEVGVCGQFIEPGGIAPTVCSTVGQRVPEVTAAPESDARGPGLEF